MDNSRGWINALLFLSYLFVAIFICLSLFLAILAEAQAAVREHEARQKADDENFNVTVKDGTCALAKGEAADPNVTLIMDKETLVGVMTGETDGMQAFMGGKLRAEGDMMLALKLGELFPA